MKVSVVLACARDDYPIVGMERTHVFEPTLKSLESQTFDNFEFIVVDALWEWRKDYFRNKRCSFPIKHLKPKSSVWEKIGAWRVCSMLNTGIIHAEGELVVRVDDCSSFGPDFLKKFWDWYKKGYFAQALVVYHHGTQPMIYNEETRKLYAETFSSPAVKGETYQEIVEKLNKLYKPGEIIRDSRWRFVEGKGCVFGNMHGWFYGYGSVSLEAFLKINGYDENFDQCKSLEETDVGSRLEMAGYPNLVIDEALTVVEHFHGPVSKKAIWYEGLPAKCNYALYRLNRDKRRFRANSDKLTEGDLKFIWEETCRSPCSHVGGKDYDYEMFKFWSGSQPIFDLKEEREKVVK
jgi:glycosyltransferase involved in cell wall biosynthesis